MEISIESKRFKEVREAAGHTQTSFAELLGIKSSTSDIERGRTRIPGNVVAELLRQFHINPLWLYGYSDRRYLEEPKPEISPKVITTDNAGSENILLVNTRAAAGYPHNIGDPEYYDQLPAFTFPLPEYRNATFRGFQVDGYSMLPALQPGEWILCRAVAGLDEVRNGAICVVVEPESVRVKKIQKETHNKYLSLISINPEYPTDVVPVENIRELWVLHSKLTSEIEISLSSLPLRQVYEELKNLKEEVGKLRQGK
ncbi:MAG TPA: DNA-binding protein [Cytophagales bacterium]|mgnify:CR=1 FL=1|jgi:phage repressor protein C with HTH and peptisase S24 domain|nr:DNA-binding protein [Cytophagales bacterium]